MGNRDPYFWRSTIGNEMMINRPPMLNMHHERTLLLAQIAGYKVRFCNDGFYPIGIRLEADNFPKRENFGKLKRKLERVGLNIVYRIHYNNHTTIWVEESPTPA